MQGRYRVGRSRPTLHTAYPAPPDRRRCVPYIVCRVRLPLPSRACEFGRLRTARGCGVAVLVVVSRFFCFAIQMNFAENQKWPPSRMWRGRAADGVGGLMRRGGARGLRRSRSTELQHLPSQYHISETHTRDLLYRLAGPEMASLAIGSRWASTSTKPVAQASRRTGVARLQW